MVKVKKSKTSFKTGDLVFAKVKGFPAWPAKIYDIDNSSKTSTYKVSFYGTQEIGYLKDKDLFLYSENQELAQKSKQKLFLLGMSLLKEELQNPHLEMKSKSYSLHDPSTINHNNNSIGHLLDTDLCDSSSDQRFQNRFNSTESNSRIHDPQINETSSKRGNLLSARSSTPSTNSEISIENVDNDENNVRINGSKRKLTSESSGSKLLINEVKKRKVDKSAILASKVQRENNSLRKKSLISLRSPSMLKTISAPSTSAVEADDANIEGVEKLKILNRELKLIYLDNVIKSCLTINGANTAKCLAAMNKMLDLDVTPLMLKKQPQLVQTVRSARKYIGNIAAWNLSKEGEALLKNQIEEIREMSEKLYNKFQALFPAQTDVSFYKAFCHCVDELNKSTQDMTLEDKLALVIDPVTSTSTAD